MGHARDWAVRTIAESLIKRAQSKFEKKRQPDVIRHAERFLLDVTDGAYQAVFSPLGSSEINVMDAMDNIKTPQQLSRGTREQLFLALRFGLILEMGQRSERLQVIVDDALVNFDPIRGTRAARVIHRTIRDQPGAGFYLLPADRGVVRACSGSTRCH